MKIENFKLKIFFGLGVFIFLIFIFPTPVRAVPTYPIPDLGNCRNARECKLYCDVPANTPACWSYDKYVMNKDILGEATVNITYPITELGNCTSAQECFIYCNQPQNQPTCLAYARKNGLVKEESLSVDEQKILESAKTELGCTSKDTCMALCSDPVNMERCRSFAQKHGLDRGGPPPEVMQKARQELGCDSESSCMNFCQNPQNQSKCFEFAKKNGMMGEEDAKRMEEMMEKKKQMMEAAKTELGCESFESCSRICEDPANREKCMNMGRKFGMVKEEIRPMNNNMQKPCTSEEECRKYCESNPAECPGFKKSDEFSRGSYQKMEEGSFSKQRQKEEPRKDGSGEYLGPSGCKTQDECRAYCEKHPDECPGFPKKQQESYPTTQSRPDTPSLQYQQYQPKPSGYPSQYLPYNPQTQNYTTTYQQIPSNYSASPYPTYYSKPPEYTQPTYSQTQNYTQNYSTNYPPPNPSEYPR